MIGGATVVKMLRLKKFSTEGYLIDEKPVLPTKKTKQKSATAFIIHYGAFHAAYLFVILNSFKEKNIPITDLLSISVIITLLFFLINHTYSYFINREEDEKKVKNIGTMMLFPYARIIPMHLAMMFGIHSAGIIGIIIFLPLKTFADTLMHNIEHYRKPKNIRIKKKVKSI
ncbi:MAG: hypothetical protein HOD12_04320 [Candidatus Magasanikbacteria bacterium]|nr:hypothetical protein [Candidatus Magasanikbacteria bacterium]